MATTFFTAGLATARLGALGTGLRAAIFAFGFALLPVPFEAEREETTFFVGFGLFFAEVPLAFLVDFAIGVFVVWKRLLATNITILRENPSF